MKKHCSTILFAAVFAVLCAAGCKNVQKNAPESGEIAEIAVENTEVSVDPAFFDFGDIKDGETVVHTFKVKNTGNSPLVIVDARTSCNCTKIKYPQGVTAPGEYADVEVSFNSSGRSGIQLKEIRIFANISEGSFKISFSANVKN